jgi:general stress protein 26
MSDSRENNWVSLNARASLSSSAEKIDELWNVAAEAYFDDGRDSVGIAVLILKCSEGRYWSSPSGRIGSLVSMARAALGKPKDSGDSGSIDL